MLPCPKVVCTTVLKKEREKLAVISKKALMNGAVALSHHVYGKHHFKSLFVQLGRLNWGEQAAKTANGNLCT